MEDVRQSMTPLAKWRFEAMIDLYAVANKIDLRGKLDDAVEALPEPKRTVTKSKREHATEFYRTDPLFDLVGKTAGMTPERIDALWIEAAAL